MTIVLTGGGSGGHITPVLAVADQLKQLKPNAKLIYIGQTGDKFAAVASKNANIDEVHLIRAGKYRRFHSEGLIRQLNIVTLLKNCRDALYVAVGLWQSRRLIKQLRPSVVFSRGGYISVPVCLGAAINKVPYITHDSDPIPSLANRLIARWASWHAVAWPKDIYPYPAEKTITTGVPLNKNFVPTSPSLKKSYREKIKVPADAKLLFVIGGGLGSQRINQAVSAVVPHLLEEITDLHVIQSVGQANEEAVNQSYQANLNSDELKRLKVFGYDENIYLYSGAADVIITRAGATNLAEFALQAKPIIVIPSGFLTGGHQLKNAEALADQSAAIVLSEADLLADPNRLAKQVSHLLKDEQLQRDLANNIKQFAMPNAAKQIAELILQTGEGR